MADRLQWGILSTGRIAGVFARGLARSRTGHLLAVASRSYGPAARFAELNHVSRSYGSYEALLADPDVEAVYIATPHPYHAEWAIAAANAGKHVLCEKPLTMNHAEAMRVIEAARRNDIFLMEAFMYRLHPQIHRMISLIRNGALGEVKLIEASFGFRAPWEPENRLFSRTLGGGAILDIGCYTTSLARLVAGVARGKDFEEPETLQANAVIGETGVDEIAAAILGFPGDILARIGCAVRLTLESHVRIFGTEGWLHLPTPWFSWEGYRMHLHRSGRGPETIEVPWNEDIHGSQADAAAEHLERRQAPSPAMSWDDSLGNMRTLDRWREAIGLRYGADSE